jgi:hypothetical protein
MKHQTNIEWWGKENHKIIYDGFINHLDNYGLKEYSKILVNKSSDVVSNFGDETIDLLHIDGNHCERLSYEDATNYFPKLRKNGYIFFDDSTWIESGDKISTSKALEYLLQYCEHYTTVGKDCMILIKVKS